MTWHRCFHLLTGITFFPLLACAQEHPVQPYVDLRQLDCPFPKHSFYKQPWRAFLETRGGDDFLQGIGVNYNISKNDELAVRLLAETGIKSFRIEIGAGSVNWEETRINDDERYIKLFSLCKKYGIRPILLLNAHHGAPCPIKSFDKKLSGAANKGDRSITLTDTSDIVPGHTGLSQLTDYIAAEVIITDVDAATGECKLSKPLPKDLPADKPLHCATLKHLPFFPVDTAQYEDSAAGWLRYAGLVTKLADDAGVADFDVEIWNELSFGSNFVHASNYFDPAPFKETADFLHPGGTCWELSRRIVEQVKKGHPATHCIWGWSNTTFFHCPVKDLPPGIEGQSYHPYGTGVRKLPDQETHRDHPDFNVEGFTPKLDIRMSEGWAHEFIQTESIMRLLNPEARKDRPAGSTCFHHYMTEHGVLPEECGITDADIAWQLKAQCALRSYCLWLNKGVDTLDYFCAWDESFKGFGLMPPQLLNLPSDARFSEIATPPMKAIQNLTHAFAGSEHLDQTVPLSVEVTELGPERRIFEGDSTHPPLMQREALAVLPWQLTRNKFVIAVYAMTYDVTKPWIEQPYRVELGGMPASAVGASRFYDPRTDRDVPIQTSVEKGRMTVTLPIADYPRLLIIGQ